MSWTRVTCLILAMIAWSVPVAKAQESKLHIKRASVGFSATRAGEPNRFKLGLWAPVTVEIQAGSEKVESIAVEVETADSENVGTIFTAPLLNLQPREARTVLLYSKPGNSDGRFAITVRDARRNVLASATIDQPPLDLRESLFLTVGARLPELQEALLTLRRARTDEAGRQDQTDSWPRREAYLTNPDRFPDLSLGYDGVDLLILATADEEINRRLIGDQARLAALASWVRNGGRLVVSVSPGQQQSAARLLGSPSWQPPLSVVPPEGPEGFLEPELPRLIKVEEWAGITDKPFPAFGGKPVPVSWLLRAKEVRPDWRVLAETPEGRPLIAQMTYGRGQVTLLAFDIDREPFSSWDGRVVFLKAIVSALEPRIPQVLIDKDAGANQPTARDLATELQTTLDQFDVPTVRFGWVALLILGYILLVGPIDYFLLGKVFKRLEWTWISFPLAVVAVSLLVFFTVHGIKGKELKLNQIDLIDFDLRTELDAKQRPVRAQALGQTWFTLLSPEINSYSIALEPNLVPNWFPFNGAPKPITSRATGMSATSMSWLGRPEYDGPAAMGRPRSQTLGAQKSYQYVDQARGLAHIPVPIWTSKSLTASWEVALPRPPFKVELQYHHDKEIIVSGTIQSFLPADLHDVWLFFGPPRCYPLQGPLKGSQAGGEVRAVAIEQRFQDILGWPRRSEGDPDPAIFPKGAYDPAYIIKEIMFHELADTGLHLRNHTFRQLDLSWRLKETYRVRQNVREAILFGRLATATGEIAELARRRHNPLPTRIRLGSADPSAPDGFMVQDTFIRAFLPVRFAPE